MEIKFYNVNQEKIKELNITITNDKINGVYNCNELINILNNPKLIKNQWLGVKSINPLIY